MAETIDWNSILDKKYPSYKIEVNAFLSSLDIANSIEISTETIFEAIKNDETVNENLKMLYKEAIYGSNHEVKNRIKNRVDNFKHALKGHPKIKKLEMMHASDYANMGMAQMKEKMNENKKKDLAHAKSLQDAADRRKMNGKEKKRSGMDAQLDDVTPKKKGKTVSTIISETVSQIEENNGQERDLSNETDKGGETSGAENKTGEKRMDKGIQKSDVRGTDWRKFIKLETGDVVYSDIEIEDDDYVPANDVTLKTYGKKDGTKGRKKLLPKQNTPTVTDKSKSTKEIIDLAESEDKEKKDKMSDLAGAFKAANTAQARQSKEEAEILKDIKRCTESVQKSSVKQTATMRAWCAQNNLNVQKYHREVEKELEDERKEQEQKDQSGPVFPPPEDEDALVPLPDFDDSNNNEYFEGHLVLDDEYGSDSSEMVPDETPFYANQEEDPEVQRLNLIDQFDE